MPEEFLGTFSALILLYQNSTYTFFSTWKPLNAQMSNSYFLIKILLFLEVELSSNQSNFTKQKFEAGRKFKSSNVSPIQIDVC